MHYFFTELFDNKYTTVIKDGQPYLTQDSSIISTEIGEALLEYGLKVKEL